MAKKKQLGSIDTRTEEFIREEALKIAHATHTPGQTKEQTKLIARGIAKGIAEYKDQQKLKQRERIRRLDKRPSPAPASLPRNHETDTIVRPPIDFDHRPALTAAGIFLLSGLLFLVCFVTGATITIGTFSIAPFWSALAGLVAIAFGFWQYRAIWKFPRKIR